MGSAIYYDPAKAARVCNFFERVLTHPKNKFTPFELIPWQRNWISQIFGRVDEEGFRVIKRAYLELGKKNGKSETAAGIGLACLACDDEPAAEIYGAATTKEQASIVFRTAAAMVENEPLLRAEFKVLRSSKTIIKRNDPLSFFKVISADGNAQDGMNPHCVIIDELHRWKTGKQFELFDVLTRSGIARRQPLLIEITTAGSSEDESPLAWGEHEYTKNLEDGLFEDPHFYGLIFGADAKDDWTLLETWKKANPSFKCFGGFLDESVIAKECNEAKNRPSRVASFKRYHLGIWGSTEEEWMPRAAWDQCSGELRRLIERPCYLGLDLSSKIDLSSLVAVFPDDDGTYDVLPYFWMAQERVRERELQDHVNYSTWIDQEFLIGSEGNVIDERDIQKKIIECTEIFDVQEVAFDPAHALQLSIRLSEKGITCVGVPQRFTHLSEPMKYIVELALQGRIRHAGHPILKWNSRCTRAKWNDNDDCKPVKPNRNTSSKRIDGMSALMVGMARAMYYSGSVYEGRGLATS